MLSLENLQQHIDDLGNNILRIETQEIDRDGKFPTRSFKYMRENGYLGLLIPKKYGGLGGGICDNVEASFHLARYCPTTAICYAMHNGATNALVKFGGDSLKDELLERIAKGEIMIAQAFREEGSYLDLGMKETKDCSRRILKGRKSFVTAAEYVDAYMTFTPSCLVEGGKNLWFIFSNNPNIIKHKDAWDGLGMRGNGSISVDFDNVAVDEAYRVGKEGDAGRQTDWTGIWGVLNFAAVYSGLGQAAYDCVLEHCRNRHYDDGSTLIDVPKVQEHLAEIFVLLESAKALVFDAAGCFEKRDTLAASKAFAARINATQNTIQICTKALGLGGGRAYNKLLPLERYMRDCLASQVMVPAIDTLKDWLGKEIKGGFWNLEQFYSPL